MKNLFFLMGVLALFILLPLDTVAQKRPVKAVKKVSNSAKTKKVKRTNFIRKRVVRKKTGIQPIAMLNGKPTAFIYPSCNMDEGRVVFTVSFHRLTSHFMKLNGSEVQLRLVDGSWTANVTDAVAVSDLQFAKELYKKVKPQEMEIYPAVQSPNSALMNMIVLTKNKWDVDELGIVKDLIISKLGPDIGITYMALECASLFWTARPQSNLAEAKPSPTPQ